MNFLRKYNVTLDLSTAGSLRIRIPIRKAGANDFAVGADWSPAAGDVKVSKDGGAQANIGTLPTYSNGSWEFTLTGTELSARLVEVRIVDSATKAVDDEGFNIETFGHASAMFADDFIVAQPTALMDLADGIETGLTPRQAMRLMSAALAGKLSGAATTTITIRNTADTKARITATVDSDGNRSALTLDAT